MLLKNHFINLKDQVMSRESKITKVYRKRLNIDKLKLDSANFTRDYVTIHPSTELELLTKSDLTDYETSLIQQSLRINKNWAYSNNRDYYEVVNNDKYQLRNFYSHPQNLPVNNYKLDTLKRDLFKFKEVIRKAKEKLEALEQQSKK